MNSSSNEHRTLSIALLLRIIGFYFNVITSWGTRALTEKEREKGRKKGRGRSRKEMKRRQKERNREIQA